MHPNWKEIATQFPARSTRIVARQYALMKSKDGMFPKKKTVDDVNKELYQKFLEQQKIVRQLQNKANQTLAVK